MVMTTELILDPNKPPPTREDYRGWISDVKSGTGKFGAGLVGRSPQARSQLLTEFEKKLAEMGPYTGGFGPTGGAGLPGGAQGAGYGQDIEQQIAMANQLRQQQMAAPGYGAQPGGVPGMPGMGAGGVPGGGARQCPT